MKLNYFKMLDKIGNDIGVVPAHLSRASMVEDAISTGSLVCDLIIGGGWPAGRWVALFGKEASAKSTLLYHTLGDAIRKDVNVEFFDFEGSTDSSYLNKILNTDLNNVFGLRKENGTWEITPNCRYFQADIGEIYFRYMHRILQILPDKLPHNNNWYYVYDKKPKQEYDIKLYKNTNRYWVQAEDSSAQVIWFIDSLPAMLTERNDEKDDSNEIALQARMFSRYIPLVKSRLARKRCSIVAVNQIRMKPMAFGNPEVEPGGIAPKQFSDIRLKCTSCANPFPGKSGQIEEEPCWDGIGIDKYRYVKINTIKNKCFSPFRNSLMRIWTEEKGDSGRGLDPVFDTFQYLEETGQATRERAGYYKITMPGPWANKKWRWKEFKELILNPDKVEVYNKYKLNIPEIGKVDENNKETQKAVSEALDIRRKCQQQIKSDEAFKLYFNKISGINNVYKEEEDEIKTCGNCAQFKKHQNCLDVDDDQKGCDDWISEEEEDSEITED